MSLKSILVNLDIDGPAEPVINAACELARRCDAALIGFCAADAQQPVMVTADTGALAAQVWQEERDDIAARMETLHLKFDKLASGLVATEWRSTLDSPTRALVSTARVADLIVMHAPKDATTNGDTARVAAPSSVVLQAGRPVLVLATGLSRLELHSVVIAWKDTREARRAIADALPLLTLADDVTVLAVTKKIEPPTRHSAADVVTFLGRHNIRANAQVIESPDETAKLTTLIASSKPDLVVFGAYGHSRFREYVFGGVTRSLLDQKDLSRFMSR